MITWSDLRDGFWLAGFLFAASLLVLLPIYAIARLWFASSDRSTHEAKVVIGAALLGSASLGFTGMVAGFLTGSSRAPAVSALVPAILTFTGLLVVYLISKSRVGSTWAGLVVFVFAANLLVGTVLGTASRDRHEELLNGLDVLKL